MHKSFCPRKRMSTPGTAAISAMLSMQDAVSTCNATMPLLLKLPAYPSRPARFIRGIDVGDQNAIGSQVESLLNARAVVVSAYTHHGFGAAIRDTREHRRKFLVAHGAVLCIHQQPVISTVRKLFRDGGTVRVQEQAHLWLAFAQLLLEVCATKSGIGHSCPPECLSKFSSVPQAFGERRMSDKFPNPM